MTEPQAHIRSFQPEDLKLTQFVISKSNMEQLAVANRTAYQHPLVLSIWIAISSIFVQSMGWWPNPEYGALGYLRPLPAFASMALPIMFLVDWLNRPFFEDQTQGILKTSDLHDIQEYYSRSPSSGFWLLEYGDRFIGLMALDASRTSDETEANIQTKAPSKSGKDGKGTASTAIIRHFFVDEPYRPTEIQNDLLNHGIRFAFQSDPTLQQIRILDSPLKPYVNKSLKLAGFERETESEGSTVGVLRWKLAMCSLRREAWAARSTA